MNNENRLYYLLLLVGAVLLFAHLGLLYVDIMEARNFVTAREMVDDGNWIFTTMNEVPRYEKPPLPTWLSAWMGNLFGLNNVWALRFPASLSCFLLMIYLYKIVHFITKNQKLAAISCFILITNFLVIYVGRRANWDIYSYSFMVIGIYYFLLALKNIKTYPNYIIAGVFFGLSVLSKGPTGPYVLLIPFYGAYVLVNGLPKWKEIWGIAFCAIITIAIGFSWYAYIYTVDAENFMAIMEKEASARGNRDVKPFTRYLSFPVQTGIWIIFSVIGLLVPMMKHRTSQPKNYMLFFYWTILSLILISLIPSKKERYLFPMMVPLAVTTGFYIYYLTRNITLKRWELTLNRFIFSLLGFVCLVLGIGIIFLDTSIYSLLFSIVSIVSSIAIFYFIYKKRDFEKVFYILISFMTCVGLFGIPLIDKAMNNNYEKATLLRLKPQLEKENLKLYSYAGYSPEMWFKWQGSMPEIIIEEPQTYPKEDTFYIGINEKTPENMAKLKKTGWTLLYVGRFDDNEEKPSSKNHVERKIHYVYKVTK